MWPVSFVSYDQDSKSHMPWISDINTSYSLELSSSKNEQLLTQKSKRNAARLRWLCQTLEYTNLRRSRLMYQIQQIHALYETRTNQWGSNETNTSLMFEVLACILYDIEFLAVLRIVFGLTQITQALLRTISRNIIRTIRGFRAKKQSHRPTRSLADLSQIALENQVRSPLLRLPPELRSIIYGYVVGENSLVTAPDTSSWFDRDWPSGPYTIPQVNLSRVCSSLYYETALLPLRTITISSLSDIKYLLRTLKRVQRASIQKIVLDYREVLWLDLRIFLVANVIAKEDILFLTRTFLRFKGTVRYYFRVFMIHHHNLITIIILDIIERAAWMNFGRFFEDIIIEPNFAFITLYPNVRKVIIYRIIPQPDRPGDLIPLEGCDIFMNFYRWLRGGWGPEPKVEIVFAPWQRVRMDVRTDETHDLGDYSQFAPDERRAILRFFEGDARAAEYYEFMRSVPVWTF